MSSLADAITQTKARIRALEAELRRLHADLDEARRALKTEPGKRRMRNRKGSKLQLPALSREPYKPDSSVARAVEVLQEAGHHLHIDELVRRIEGKGHRVMKSTLVGNLSRYVKVGEVFTRHSRSHYGLLEWQRAMIDEMLEDAKITKSA
jgi:hypothetical protein